MQPIYTESQLCTGSWISQFLVHPMATCLGSVQREQMCSPCKGLFLSLQDARTLYVTQTCFPVLIETSLLSFHPETKVRVGLLGLSATHDPALCPKLPHLRQRNCR